MSRADAAALLERARALVMDDTRGDISDQSDPSTQLAAPSVASIAYVATGVCPATSPDDALHLLLDTYVAGKPVSSVFASWTEAAGLRFENRHGVLVALRGDEVVAAHDTNPRTDREYRDVLWSIVKDAKGMDAGGHAAAVRWARVALGLDDRPEAVDRRISRRPGVHVHGWKAVDGLWTCVQDFYAVGMAPETGCGATWVDGVETAARADRQRDTSDQSDQRLVL